MRNYFPIGKLDAKLLAKLIKKYYRKNKALIVPPKIGEDAAVIKEESKYLVLTTDPITLTKGEVGLYSVYINANDIASMGGEPKWFLTTNLLPEGKTSEKDVEALFKTVSSVCQDLGIAWIGGHIEITSGLKRPIVVGEMIGTVKKDKITATSNSKLGDDLLLVKGIAIEGTAIIAREKEKYLKKRFPPSFLKRAKNFLIKPGISILKEALLANNSVKINAMHDPTEGGLSTGIMEVAQASEKGILVFSEAIKIYQETEILCREFGLDPLGLIASGSLLISLPPKESPKLLKIFRRKGIPVSIIGKIKQKKFGYKLKVNGRIKKLPRFEVDEITKIYRRSW